ncbi:MAG: hypothetical protein ABFD89_09645 [Bryobacteraceae bacterium]
MLELLPAVIAAPVMWLIVHPTGRIMRRLGLNEYFAWFMPIPFVNIAVLYYMAYAKSRTVRKEQIEECLSAAPRQ